MLCICVSNCFLSLLRKFRQGLTTQTSYRSNFTAPSSVIECKSFVSLLNVSATYNILPLFSLNKGNLVKISGLKRKNIQISFREIRWDSYMSFTSLWDNCTNSTSCYRPSRMMPLKDETLAARAQWRSTYRLLCHLNYFEMRTFMRWELWPSLSNIMQNERSNIKGPKVFTWRTSWLNKADTNF